ncbi:MAG: ABC transporter ATP-binding protein [Saprospiraceae bacterium]|nr:ABC transporter ATP-binding protein [Saprospiraceae bacterium]
MDNSIHIDGLSMNYPKTNVHALTAFSLNVKHGELFGIIGPDGAGKTTLFRILTTLILPDTGSATVAGFDVQKDFWEIRKIVGYMPGRFSLYQDLTVDENLRFFATVFKTTVEDNYHLIKDIYQQLEPFKSRRAGKLSGGMKQKLALCCALIHEPRVLFLDEPTTGVDPVSRKEFWDMLVKLKEKGITILVSTPYMDEAARCDRIALMQKGKILDVDTYAGILRKNSRPTLAVSARKMSVLLKDLRKYPKSEKAYSFGAVHHLIFKNNSNLDLEPLRQYLKELGHQDVEMEMIDSEIEDVFIDLMEKVA